MFIHSILYLFCNYLSIISPICRGWGSGGDDRRSVRRQPREGAAAAVERTPEESAAVERRDLTPVRQGGAAGRPRCFPKV